MGILKHILQRGVGLVGVALALGTVVAVASSRALSGMLFGISAVDPATFLGATVLLGAVALVACYAPARRASRVDPLEALRTE